MRKKVRKHFFIKKYNNKNKRHAPEPFTKDMKELAIFATMIAKIEVAYLKKEEENDGTRYEEVSYVHDEEHGAQGRSAA